MSTILLSINIGTSNTSIYKCGEGMVLVEPSMIAFSGTGKNKVIKAVGIKAKKMLGRSGGTSVVSPIFEGSVIDSEMATEMLKVFLSKVSNNKLFRPKIIAVLCVPMGLSKAEKATFEKVCYNAGISEVTLIPKVVATAIGYSMDISSAHGSLIAVMGGGTSEVAVLSLNSIISGMSLGIGGSKIDVAIEKYIEEKCEMEIGAGVSEKIKQEIGSLYANDNSETEFMGTSKKSGIAEPMVVHASELFPVISYYYDLLAETISSMISACPPDIVSDITNDGVFLFGGSLLMTGSENYFKKKIGVKVLLRDDIIHADVIGGAMLLENPKQLKELLTNL
ncbi:MAG: rod shape-determining protein [Clostridia bacterium]